MVNMGSPHFFFWPFLISSKQPANQKWSMNESEYHFLSLSTNTIFVFKKATIRPGLPWSSSGQNESSLIYMYSMPAEGPSQNFAEAQWSEQNSFGRVGVFEKNRTLGFKWCFIYTLVWELKPEVGTFVRFGGREGVSSETDLFVSLGRLWTFAMAPKPDEEQGFPGRKVLLSHTKFVLVLKDRKWWHDYTIYGPSKRLRDHESECLLTGSLRTSRNRVFK